MDESTKVEDVKQDNDQDNIPADTDDIPVMIDQEPKQKNRQLFIVTYSPDRKLSMEYTTSLLKTKDYFREKDIIVNCHFASNPLVDQYVKNNFVTSFMNTQANTHIVFIHPDMVWNPEALQILLDLDLPFVAAPPPISQYNWGALEANAKSGGLTLKQIRPYLTDYNFLRDNNVIKNGLLSVRYTALDFAVISRECLIQMIETYPAAYKNENSEVVYSLFESRMDESGVLRTFDEMFCEKYKKINGDIYIAVNINIGRNGNEQIIGCLGNLVNIIHTKQINESKELISNGK